jgi:hypothetical protein
MYQLRPPFQRIHRTKKKIELPSCLYQTKPSSPNHSETPQKPIPAPTQIKRSTLRQG